MANSAEIFKERSDDKNPSGVASAQAPSLWGPSSRCIPIFIGEYAFLDTRPTGAVHFLSASGGSQGLAEWVPSHSAPRAANFIHLRRSYILKR